MTGRDHALLVRMVQASRSLSNIAADARRQRSNEFSGQSLQEAGQVLHALADEMIAHADHAGEPVEAVPDDACPRDCARRGQGC